MIEILHTQLSDKECAFLLSLVRDEPQWELLEVPHARELPAIKWKLQNLAALKRDNPTKFSDQYQGLSERFKAIGR
jgi:hypothetical protein